MSDNFVNYPGDRDTTKGPFNTCIYCQKEKDPARLTDEHAVAETLGGRLVLLKAVCATCNAAINRIESRVHNQMFAAVRAHLRVKKTKSQGRRGRFPVTTTTGGVKSIIRVPINEHPTMLYLPAFPIPGLMEQVPAAREFRQVRLWAWSLGLKEEFEKKIEAIKRATGADTAVDEGQIYGGAFCRYLAKSAHCTAVATFGLDSFRPFLPNIILNEFEPFTHLVGTLSEGAPPQTVHPHNEITLNIMVDHATEHKILLCSIRLFAWMNTPVYGVVVGEPAAQLEQLLASRDPGKGGDRPQSERGSA